MRNDEARSSMNILNSPRGWNHMLMVISSFATPLKLLINLKPLLQTVEYVIVMETSSCFISLFELD